MYINMIVYEGVTNSMYKIQNYKTSAGQICLMSCISDVFNQYGLEVNESIIFALSEASQFYYKHFNIEEALHNNATIKLFDLVMGGIQFDIPWMVNNVLGYFDMTLDIDSGLEIAETKEFIAKHIYANQPVLALLSRKHLEYMDKSFKDDITHSINIVGYNQENNDLYISDTYIPTNPVTTYEGILTLEEYYKCLLSSKDIFKKQFTFRNIVFIKHSALPFTALSTELIFKPVKNLALRFFKENTEGEILIGMKAYKQFFEDYEEWMLIEDSSIVLNLMRYVHHRLTNFGGPVISNRLLAEYMGYLHEKESKPEFLKLKTAFQDLSKNWFIAANLFGKTSYFITEKAKINLHQRLADMLQAEEAVYHMIMEL